MTNKQKNLILLLQRKLGGPSYPDQQFIFGKNKIGFTWTTATASQAIEILKERENEENGN